MMAAKGIADRVHAVHFHKWCRDQLVAYGQTLPAQHLPVGEKMAEMVQRVITGIDRRQIPSSRVPGRARRRRPRPAPEWLRLVVQMVDPTTNSLLVLYDDAQSIYEHAKKKNFSFRAWASRRRGAPPSSRSTTATRGRYCKRPASLPLIC
ncbi:MAG: hypothetical protein R3E70_14390 [Burkholderiaceae bacterium]